MKNREFLIAYRLQNDDTLTYETFRTIKQFCDWFNLPDSQSVTIVSITERPGNPAYDKYFKEIINDQGTASK